jgi:tRNA-dihydrouridine synthase A
MAEAQRMKSPGKIGSNGEKKGASLDRRICVAPMMDYTDRHFRFLLRLLSPSALLYTEMINAQAVVRGDAARHLAYDTSEHPVALQLGGNSPKLLAQAALIGEQFGYDEINLNCGCPSDRVQSGRFGACLMREPGLVADCIIAMRETVAVPVTVKCRIGTEPSANVDDYRFLCDFVAAIDKAGCDTFIVHARKAVLTGLTPKENREIPPLRYDIVGRLRSEFPHLTIILNGGIRTVSITLQYLSNFSGVMLGREICDNPYRLAELHQAIVDSNWQAPKRDIVVLRYRDYVRKLFDDGERLAPLLRPVLSLYAGQPRARSWRRFLSERATLTNTTPDILSDALRIVGSENCIAENVA